MKLLIIGIILVLSVLGLFAYIHSIADTEEEALMKKWDDSTTSDCPYYPRPENATFDPTICAFITESNGCITIHYSVDLYTIECGNDELKNRYFDY